MENEVTARKHLWRDNAIQIYSSELHHWEDIRSYHQARVDEADAKINERFQLISDLEGKLPIQPELELDVPKLKPIKTIPPFRFNPSGLIRHFTGKI